MSLRLCESSGGKTYLRNTCKPKHKEVERIETDELNRYEACFKKYSKNAKLLNKCINGEISPYPPPMVI